MPSLEIVPFSAEHLDPAAELLRARHRRHREAEPLLPEIADFRPEIEREWHTDGASGVFANRDGKPAAYLIARPVALPTGLSWMIAGIAGHAIEGDPEPMRDVYARAAETWFDAGHARHAVFVPASDPALIDTWFRLSFGASAALAARETTREEPFEAGLSIRRGTQDDFDDAARLELALTASMLPSPSFSGLILQTQEEVAAEWREEDDEDKYVYFLAERDAEIVGHVLLYRRPPDLRVPKDGIDLAQVVTAPEARGSGVGRALTAHAIGWAYDAGYPVMVTDWRMTNLVASRFWPKRGFRETFLRLYRSIP